jgi:hypothetical protein
MSGDRVLAAHANLGTVVNQVARMPRGVVVGWEDVAGAAAVVQAEAAVETLEVLEQISAHLATISATLSSWAAR